MRGTRSIAARTASRPGNLDCCRWIQLPGTDRTSDRAQDFPPCRSDSNCDAELIDKLFPEPIFPRRTEKSYVFPYSKVRHGNGWLSAGYRTTRALAESGSCSLNSLKIKSGTAPGLSDGVPANRVRAITESRDKSERTRVRRVDRRREDA